MRTAVVVLSTFAFAAVALPTCYGAKGGLPTKIEDALAKAEWKTAAELLRDHVETQRDDVEAWYELGRSLFQAAEYPEALSAFQMAVKLRPDDRPTAVMLARTAAELGNIAALDTLPKSFAHDPDVLFFSGVTALIAQRNSNEYWGRFDARFQASWSGYAIRDFQWLAAIDPAYPGLDRRLGYCFLQMRDRPNLEQAMPHLQRATLTPDSGWEDSAALAECLTRLDLPQSAEKHWTEAKRRGGNANELDFRRARTLREMGRSYEALEGFKRVFAAQGNYPSIRHEIGIAAFDACDFATALWAFGESRRLTGHPRDDFMIGRTAYAMGDDAWAEKVFSDTLASLDKEIEDYRAAHKQEDPDHFWIDYQSELRHYLGRAQWGTGKRSEAIKNLEGAWQKTPWNDVYRRWLFRWVLASDDFDKAMTLVEQLNDQYAPAVIADILAKWPNDQPAKPPHRLRLMRKAAEAHFSQTRFAAALKGFDDIRKEIPGAPPSLEHVWSAMINGDLAETEKLLASIGPLESLAADEARVAQAVLLLRQGKPDLSVDAVKPIADMSPYADVRDAVLLHAGMAAGRTDIPKADPFTALGVVLRVKSSTVLAVFPGSPAESAGVLPGDRLNVVGEFYFYPNENWHELRAVGLPGHTVNLVVVRLSQDGEEAGIPIVLDYRPLLNKLGIKPDPNSAFKSWEEPG